jgi:hypothetical protein
MTEDIDTARELKPFTRFGFGATASDDAPEDTRTLKVQTVNPDGSPIDREVQPAAVPELALVPDTDDGGAEGKESGTPAPD